MKKSLFLASIMLSLVFSRCEVSAEQKKLALDIDAAAKSLVEIDEDASESLKIATNAGNAAIQTYEEAKSASNSKASKAAEVAVEAMRSAISLATSLQPVDTKTVLQTAEKYLKEPGSIEEMKKELELIHALGKERKQTSDDASTRINNAKKSLDKALGISS